MMVAMPPRRGQAPSGSSGKATIRASRAYKSQECPRDRSDPGGAPRHMTGERDLYGYTDTDV